MKNNKRKIIALLGMLLAIVSSTLFSCNKNKKELIFEASNILTKNATLNFETIEEFSIAKEEETKVEISKAADIKEANIVDIPKVNNKKIVISAVGDCTLGTDINSNYYNSFNEYFDKNGSEYFFRKVKDIFKEDDLTIANLENAFTNSKEHPTKEWVYGGKPSYAKILKDANIEIVSLANNHTMDYFKIGLEDTKNALKAVGVEYAYKDIVNYKNIKDIKVAIVSVAWDNYNDIKKYMKEAKENSDLQIVCMHSGVNYEKNYNIDQERLAYFLVDNGADLVLGTHPHVVQGLEKYKGVYIAYSLGNFSYGGKKTLSTENDTMILQATFEYENNVLISNEIKIIPAYMSSSFPKNDYQPMVVNDNLEKERIMNKIKVLSKNIS